MFKNATTAQIEDLISDIYDHMSVALPTTDGLLEELNAELDRRQPESES